MANRAAARIQALLMARCMGSVLAWASRATVGVVFRAPVMNMVDVRWMRASFVAKPVDPCFFLLPGAGSRMGLHHTSAAYNILGMTTLLWSHRACRLGTALRFCESHRI